MTGLPVSHHDHGVNGLQFDDSGDLLIASGGNTNAGIAVCSMGNIPESPFSSAILRAKITSVSTPINLTYRDSVSQIVNMDERAGEAVEAVPGSGVEVLAPGFRNAFDILWSTEGQLFATENGPNDGFGPASTSATTESPDPHFEDELNFVVEGAYYGHPNRSRGKTDPRENVYYNPFASPLLGVYAAPLASTPPLASTNGIEEYRSRAFGGAMRGELLLARLSGELYRAKVTNSGTTLGAFGVVGNYSFLDVVMGPGGAILGTDYYGGGVRVAKPINPVAAAVEALDISPARARAVGGTPFVIGGVGFAGTTTVSIGGASATVTSVSPTRIRGTIPAQAAPTGALLDVSVTSNGMTSLLPKAFRYVFPAGAGKGIWETGPAMPLELSEIAGGIINGVMYIFGDGDTTNTCGFEFTENTWNCNLAARPFPGHHHSSEVIGKKLYVFGGLGGNSENKVQVYDPLTNSWSLKGNMPLGGSGAASTALIDGKVYYAGGIRIDHTVYETWRYDPGADTWTALAPPPLARNHAAAATDGKKLYIFGGRGPGSGDFNTTTPGFDDTLAYDPATNTWDSSTFPASQLVKVPQRRGGMGKAVYFRGEFFVIGGETSTPNEVPNNVYNRVDVYNPVTNTWRLEAALPTARHGIYPMKANGRIYVAAGGPMWAHSHSDIFEIFRP